MSETGRERQPPEVALQRSWTHVSAALLSTVVHETDTMVHGDHVLLVNAGGPYRMEEHLDGRTFLTHGSPGDVAVVLAGTPVGFRSRTGTPQPVTTLALRIDPGFLDQVSVELEITGDAVELVGALGSHSPQIERAARLFLPELEQEQPLDQLYGDSLANLLAVTVLRSHSSFGARAGSRLQKPIGGLSSTALSRVIDHVEDNLASDLSLAQLSRVAHLSQFHFSRAFKLATGVSPHQFVLRRRVQRARLLLDHSDLPVHAVAQMTGFADQSHLSRHFRLQVGVAPGEYRLRSG